MALILLFQREKLACLYHFNFDDKNPYCVDFSPLVFILLPSGKYINTRSTWIKAAEFCLLTFCQPLSPRVHRTAGYCMRIRPLFRMKDD